MKKRRDFLKTSFLLRAFNLSFGTFAMMPLLVFIYLYYSYDKNNLYIDVPREQLEALILIIGTASLFLFLGLRTVLKKIVILTGSLKESLYENIDREVILQLAQGEGEVAELAKSFGDMMNKLEDNIKHLEVTKKTLYDVLSKVGRAMTSLDNFDLLVDLVLETTVNSLGAQKGVVFILKEDGTAQVKSSVGIKDILREEILVTAEHYIDTVVARKKMLFVSSLEEPNNIFVPPVICTPLICRNKTWGVLCVCGRKHGDEEFIDDEVSMLSNLSYQIAIAFENVSLNKDRERTYFETMAALALAVEAKDSYSRGHSERVGLYAARIAEEMDIAKNDVQTLKDAARLHDIGKIGIADSVLNKPGRFTQEEREIMKKHPIIGESIVKPLKTFKHLLNPIRHHHEFLDGSGYPDGLTGEQLPLITRIITVADIYDAMTSDRVYRKALSIEQVKKELQEMVGQGKLDKSVVSTLLMMVEEKRI